MNVWICVVRNQAFVGGESQRCRHPRFETELLGCGVMELIGGEPLDYCVAHSSPGWSNSIGVTDDECYEVVFIDSEASGLDCLFESQIRVGP